MDQANQQSTIDSAAEAMLSSGAIDSILGEEETETPEQQPVAEVDAEETEEQDTDTAEDVETDEDNTEDDDSEEVEQDEGEESESDEEQKQVDIESAGQLAEALGVSVDDLLDNLKVDVVIDGESQSVTLREAQAGYQKDADYRRKTSELAQQRREFETQAQQRAQDLEGQHQVAANVLMYVEQQMLRESDPQAMAELRNSDPVAWAAKYAEQTERKQQLEQLKQQAATAYQQHQQRLMQEQAEAAQLKIAEEMEALQKRVPDIKEVAPKINGYLSESYGFTNDELRGVADHRLVDLARKAMLYDQQASKAQVAKKKVKAAPKMQKPARKAPQPDAKVQKQREAKRNLKKSGHVRDAASAIENLL